MENSLPNNRSGKEVGNLHKYFTSTSEGPSKKQKPVEEMSERDLLEELGVLTPKVIDKKRQIEETHSDKPFQEGFREDSKRKEEVEAELTKRVMDRASKLN